MPVLTTYTLRANRYEVATAVTVHARNQWLSLDDEDCAWLISDATPERSRLSTRPGVMYELAQSRSLIARSSGRTWKRQTG